MDKAFKRAFLYLYGICKECLDDMYDYEYDYDDLGDAY